MKYEKFEEWMIGKKFYNTYDHDDLGVIVGIRDAETVNVIYQNDGASWARLCNVNFVDSPDENPPREDGQIDWQVGQVVWDVRNGRGIVKEVRDDEYYPIYVVFDLTDCYGDAVSDTYTLDGRYVETQKNRSLFFSEPVVTAELFPTKKPFVPTLKKGDKVVLTDSVADYVAEVVREEENHIYYKTEDGVVTFVDKNLVKVFKLWEEIKFQ